MKKLTTKLTFLDWVISKGISYKIDSKDPSKIAVRDSDLDEYEFELYGLFPKYRESILETQGLNLTQGETTKINVYNNFK